MKVNTRVKVVAELHGQVGNCGVVRGEEISRCFVSFDDGAEMWVRQENLEAVDMANEPRGWEILQQMEEKAKIEIEHIRGRRDNAKDDEVRRSLTVDYDVVRGQASGFHRAMIALKDRGI